MTSQGAAKNQLQMGRESEMKTSVEFIFQISFSLKMWTKDRLQVVLVGGSYGGGHGA